MFPEISLETYQSNEKYFTNWTSSSLKSLKLLEKIQPHDIITFTGQNILHIVIIHREIKEAQWLLNFYQIYDHEISMNTNTTSSLNVTKPSGLIRLLSACAIGSFFTEMFDFGGFPLLFAVCSGDTEMFDLILAYASTIDPGNANLKG